MKRKNWEPEEMLNECIKVNDKAHQDYFKYVAKIFYDKLDLSKITDIHFQNDYLKTLEN